MLIRMVLQGLTAAVLIGGAATVYAQTRDNGYLKPDVPALHAAPRTDATDAPSPGSRPERKAGEARPDKHSDRNHKSHEAKGRSANDDDDDD